MKNKYTHLINFILEFRTHQNYIYHLWLDFIQVVEKKLT